MQSVDACVDDRHADPPTAMAASLDRRDVQGGDALVEQRLDRERRPRRDPDRPELGGERRLPLGWDLDDHDARASMRLTYRRAEAREQVRRDPRTEALAGRALGVARGKDRRPDRRARL